MPWLYIKALTSNHLLSPQGKEEEDKSFDMPPSWVSQIEITLEGLCHLFVSSPQGVLWPQLSRRATEAS